MYIILLGVTDDSCKRFAINLSPIDAGNLPIQCARAENNICVLEQRTERADLGVPLYWHICQ